MEHLLPEQKHLLTRSPVCFRAQFADNPLSFISDFGGGPEGRSWTQLVGDPGIDEEEPNERPVHTGDWPFAMDPLHYQ